MSTLLATIQARRGLKANLPTSCAPGELLWAEDTHELFIGDATGLPTQVGAGGGGAPTGSNIMLMNSMLAEGWNNNNAGLGGYSLLTGLMGNLFLNAGAKCQINIVSWALGTGLKINKATLQKWTRTSSVYNQTYISTSPVTWNGGNASPSLNIGDNLSDPIAMAIDANHCYQLMIYFDPTTDVNAALKPSEGATPYASYSSPFPEQAIFSGDWTGYTTYPPVLGYGPAGLYWSGSYFVMGLERFVTA